MLKKLCRSAKDNDYTSSGFYPWVSRSTWVSYTLVLSRGGRRRKEEIAATSSFHGDAVLHHLCREIGLRCEGSYQSAPPDQCLVLVK